MNKTLTTLVLLESLALVGCSPQAIEFEAAPSTLPTNESAPSPKVVTSTSSPVTSDVVPSVDIVGRTEGEREEAIMVLDSWGTRYGPLNEDIDRTITMIVRASSLRGHFVGFITDRVMLRLRITYDAESGPSLKARVG